MKHIKSHPLLETDETEDLSPLVTPSVMLCTLTLKSVEIRPDETSKWWPISTHLLKVTFLNRGNASANDEAVLSEIASGNYELSGAALWSDHLKDVFSPDELRNGAERAQGRVSSLEFFLEDLEDEVHRACVDDYLAEHYDEEGEPRIEDPKEALSDIYFNQAMSKISIERLPMSSEEVQSFIKMDTLRSRAI